MRLENDSLEAFLQVDPCYDTPKPFHREHPSTERTLGTSLIFPSPVPEKEEKILFYINILCHLSSSLPLERVWFPIEHRLCSRQQAGNTEQNILYTIVWPKLINSSHLFQGQLNEDKLKGKLKSLENQLYTCTQVSILENTSRPGIQN